MCYTITSIIVYTIFASLLGCNGFVILLHIGVSLIAGLKYGMEQRIGNGMNNWCMQLWLTHVTGTVQSSLNYLLRL